MKYLVKFFVIVLLFFYSTTSISETISIVYINMDKVMNQSLAGKDLKKQLDSIHKKNIDEFAKIEENLKSEESSIKSQKNILSEEEYNKKVNLFKNKIEDYKKKRKEKIDYVSKKKIEATKMLLNEVTPILTNYSKEKGISIILKKKDILLAKTELDITDEIISLVDLKIKKIDLN
tara:strand:+ start:2936 stop:3463 length:528 start_codon:yes stop_codon:yes gene_type:complete